MRWWTGQERERFWLEATDRPDIGVDLKAPYNNAAGKDEWRYGLFREAEPGDIVFHYDSEKGAITSRSRVAGREQARPLVWAARGTYARERGAQPEELPGYFVPLDDHRLLRAPVTLERLRASQPELLVLLEGLKERHRQPLYFPFEIAGRPLRPNQGYSFKLPADFVAAFDALAEGAGDALLPFDPSQAPPPSLVRQAVAKIEGAAFGYAVGGLQQLRRELNGFKKLPGTRIFTDQTTFPKWAFHHGGRSELQFNVGLEEPEGDPAIRVGVAFSLERSPSLLDWRVLIPRIARFNDFLRESPAMFSDLAMWHEQGDWRSPDRAPEPIDPAIVREGAFIFLGDRQPAADFDAHAALRTMDRLLVLYRHVQSGSVEPPPPEDAPPRRQGKVGLSRGVESKSTDAVTRAYTARTLDISLRHNMIQNGLKALVEAEGLTAPKLEARLGQRSVDLVAKSGEELWFYEVKTAATARQCLREAIGQLLEYALWPGHSNRPTKLIVVGEPGLDDETREYLALVNARFPICLEYRQVSI